MQVKAKERPQTTSIQLTGTLSWQRMDSWGKSGALSRFWSFSESQKNTDIDMP